MYFGWYFEGVEEDKVVVEWIVWFIFGCFGFFVVLSDVDSLRFKKGVVLYICY